MPLHQPGEITGRTVLNVFGPMGHGGRWILDSLKVIYLSSNIALYNVIWYSIGKHAQVVWRC